MASSSTLLSMSMPPTPEPGVAQVQSTCAACSLDVSEKVSQLFKRYEQLQDLINNFMLRQAEGKLAKKPKHRQVRPAQEFDLKFPGGGQREDFRGLCVDAEA